MSRVEGKAMEEPTIASWEEDTIYCEATCDPEDVLYKGSDDEDYDDSDSRRLRYEAAGQKFLDGQSPFILTATLQGPFDSASAWVNPWRSKHRTAGTAKGERQSPRKLTRSLKHQRNTSVPETQFGQHDSLECHLPSPESVKQAPLVAAHPFLEDDELSMVQRWRNAVPQVAKDGFWATTPRGTMSDRKRKAKGSEWLRKLANKRRRTDFMESDSMGTPVPKQPASLRGDNDALDVFTSSFSSLPDRLPSSAITTARTLRRYESADNVQGKADEEEEEDELNDSLTVSFSSAPTRLGSPRKRTSPKKSLKTRAIYETAKDSEDELSRDEIAAIKAAATLSSPVSQNQFSQPLPRRSPRHVLSRRILEHQSPSRRSALGRSVMETDEFEESRSADGENLATQRDGSFCYKMGMRLVKDKNDQKGEHSESWSGISNSGEEFLVKPGEAKDVSTETEDSSSPDADITTAPESETMDVDKDVTSSELSSMASEDVGKLEDIAGDNSDIGTTSDSETSSASDTGSETCRDLELNSNQASTAVGIAEPKPVDVPEDLADNNGDLRQGRPQENRDSPSAEPKGRGSQDDYTGNGSSESTSESESDDTKSISSEVSEPTAPQPTVEKSHSLPEHLGLLKCSVKRFIPKASWAKLSQTIGQSSSSPTRMPSSPARIASSPARIASTPARIASTPVRVASTPARVASTPARVASTPAKIASSSMRQAMTSPITESSLTIERPSKIDSKHHPQLSSPKTLLAENSSVETPQPSKAIADARPSSESSHQVSSTTQPSKSQQTLGQEQILGQKQILEQDKSAQATDRDPVPASQQSPWARSQLSQYATLAMTDLPQKESNLGTPEMMDDSSLASSDAQNPWANVSTKLPMAPPLGVRNIDNANPLSALHTVNTTCSISSQVQNEVSSTTPAISPAVAPPRPSTPEPQFSFKSMASFMSPSPERRPRSNNRRAAWPDSASRLPSTQGILASATKNPWSADVSQRRVSWAPLPHEMSSPAATGEVPSLIESRTRCASPPPTTPIAELPTSEDAKFHDHFSAVARRSGSSKAASGLRHRLLPTASQRSLASPTPQAMAETFLAADQLQKPTISSIDTCEDTAGMDRPGECYQESQEPIDIVEDVMREMGDYLGTWDVDMELDLARKGGGMQTPQLTQSPW